MIAIVSDSTAYITSEEARSLGVGIVPETYSVNNQIFNETYADKNGTFERLVIKHPGQCKTAHASVGAFMSMFSEFIRQGIPVFCLTISSRLSGTFSSAAVAAKELSCPDIIVVDSHTTAGGLHLLLEETRRLAAHDGMTLHILANAVQALREKVGIVFSVDNMDVIRRSGRLGMVRASIGTVLNVKPILRCSDGAVVSDGQVRGVSAQIRAIADAIPQAAKKIILHSFGDSSKLSLLAQEVIERYPRIPLLCRRLGPVLGIHLGQGTLGAAWITE